MIKYTFIFSIILAVLFTLLQFSVNMAAWLYERQAPGVSIELEKSWINPFTGALSISGISISSPLETHEIEVFEIVITPSSLFSNTVNIKSLKLKNLKVSNSISPKGSQVFGVPLNISHPLDVEVALTFDQLRLQDINVGIDATPSAFLSTLTIDNLNISISENSLPEGDFPWLSLKHYSAKDIKWSNEGIEVGQHEIQGLNQYYSFTKEKILQPITLLSQVQVEQSKEKTDLEKTEVENPPLKWTINSINVIESHMTLMDLDSDIEWLVNIEECNLHSIKDTKPQNFLCKLNVNDASLKFSGYFNIHNQSELSEIDVEFNDLNLVDFTYYIEPIIGYKVHTGMFNLKSKLVIENNILHAKNDVLVRKLSVQPVDESLAGNLNKQLSMPLPMAIHILNNDQDNIELSLPLDGEIGSPSLNLNHIYNMVTQKILKTALLFTLQESFQPYGSMISLGQLVGDYLFSVRLKPLEFDALSKELTDAHTEYLAFVSETLIKNPTYQLSICGFSTVKEFSDEDDFNAQWKKLAVARSQAVKQYLESLNKDVRKQLILCQPQINSKTPIVELGIN